MKTAILAAWFVVIGSFDLANCTTGYATTPKVRIFVESDLPGGDPDDEATIPHLKLEPFIDNSTFSTELSNNNINVMLETPFGSLSPILDDKEDYFFKSNISTTFFAMIFNTERLNRQQRQAVRI